MTLYTVQDIATMLQFTPQTVRKWISSGRLKASRVGKRSLRVQQTDLEHFLDTHRTIPKLTGVAVWFQGKVYSLLAPSRHCHVLHLIVKETGVTTWAGNMHKDQGFIDAKGCYLNRYQALKRARMTRQISIDHDADILFSEDLW